MVMGDVPDLEFYPDIDCTVCDGTVDCDNTTWWCNFCGTTWDRNGTNGERRGRGAKPLNLPGDLELPGMWENADLIGGQTDT